jgi:hypothetical protein
LTTAGAVAIPGMTQTFTLTYPMNILMTATGQFNQSSYAGTDMADIYYYVDGTLYFVNENWTSSSYNYSNVNWVFNSSYSFSLAAGSHTVAVYSYLRTKNAAGSITVGNAAGFTNTAYMTVTAVHQ